MKTELQQVQDELRARAGELLRARQVDVFVGHQKASLALRNQPLFATQAEEAASLAFNSFCANNLAVYARDLLAGAPQGRRIGLMLKPCDLRSLRVLVQEHQLRREQVVLLSATCPGMIDARKVERLLQVEALGAGEDDHGQVHLIVGDGREVSLPRNDLLADECLRCQEREPGDCDLRVGPSSYRHPPPAANAVEPPPDSQEQRWRQFTRATEDCLRCYACRQACPLCYCKTCVCDATQPRWLNLGNQASDLQVFHLTRALHLYGRCTDCGACQRACPMGIDTRVLLRQLNREIESVYGARPGARFDDQPVLCRFDQDDPQDFITEP